MVMREQEGIKEAVVVVREQRPGEKQLVGYAVREKGAAVNTAQLREAMARRLPEYMVPWTVVFVEEMPLSPNGKIDRKKLPPPDTTTTLTSFIAPRTEFEEAVAGIWRELLGLDRVGVEDNFYGLGGHSLLLMQLSHRIRADFGVDVGLRTLFDTPTVAQMTVVIAAELMRLANSLDVEPLLNEVNNFEQAK
jgi:aryl carrier-like protein